MAGPCAGVSGEPVLDRSGVDPRGAWSCAPACALWAQAGEGVVFPPWQPPRPALRHEALFTPDGLQALQGSSHVRSA